MADEPEVDVQADDTATESSQETTEQEATETEATEESDSQEVPEKNRHAEAQRKARQAAKAERELLTPKTEIADTGDEALRIVEQIAEQKVMKRLEPVLAKQFLMENPDAVEMIEDINRIRAENPEISSVDKLEIAYKIAKAERQDELIRKRVEAESKANEETVAKATQASAEGTGKTKSSGDSLEKRIASAGSLKELKELEAMITR